NVPADVVWYAPRTSELWKGVMWAIFVLHFVVPFFLLLMRPVKRNSTTVAWVATLILLMQLVFLCYEVLPGGSRDDGTLPAAARLIEAGMVLLIPLALGCLWLARFLQQLVRRPLVPPHDWNRKAALHLRRLEHEERAREEGRVNG
ncbi:MAG: hypothetical protein LLG00_09750, partial [Planctomycetaceae bacterium]|nr:hypothetical protein [Planctomycetaceae bacterium]